jgi:hypothetical protein
MAGVQSLAEARELFSSPRRPDRWTQPPVQWVQGILSPGVKREWREADHSLPSSAEVKNGEAITSLSHTFNGMVLN